MAFYGRWAPYVPVAQRRAKAAREVSKLTKKGAKLRPIKIESRTIATSFWGVAWCNNLEIYADWANRMPRGRTYARNGSIVDLQIEKGRITSMVSGSRLYKIKISIDTLAAQQWQAIRNDCTKQVSSLLDLMRGKLPDVVLKRLTDPKHGMFPNPNELKLQCSCPDDASMCKHIAATLYGVGHLLDAEPALFFKMRGVDQSELVDDAIATQATGDAIGLNQQSELDGEDLGAIFGIDLTTTQSDPIIAARERKSSALRRKSLTLGKPKLKEASPATVNKAATNNKATTVKKATKNGKSATPEKTDRSIISNAQKIMGETTKKPLVPKTNSKSATTAPLSKPKKKTARHVTKLPAVSTAKENKTSNPTSKNPNATKAKR